MIHTTGKLGCAAGSGCCADCGTHRLGDVPAAALADTGIDSSAWLLTAVLIIGGFGLAYVASGKAGRGTDGR
jgi:hypothetical protein